jgi:hypothetical protein
LQDSGKSTKFFVRKILVSLYEGGKARHVIQSNIDGLGQCRRRQFKFLLRNDEADRNGDNTWNQSDYHKPPELNITSAPAFSQPDAKRLQLTSINIYPSKYLYQVA